MHSDRFERWHRWIAIALLACGLGAFVWYLWPDPQEQQAWELFDELRRVSAEQGALPDGRADAYTPLPGTWEVAMKMVPLGEKAVPAIMEGLRDGDKDVRYCCIGAAGEVGPPARETGPLLAEILQAPDGEGQRFFAAAVLGRIEPETDVVVPQLLSALRSSDPSVRASAAAALGHIGPRANRATAALTAMGSDPDPQVRMYTGYALARLGAPSQGVHRLVAETKDPDSRVSGWAFRFLEFFEQDLPDLEPELRKAIADALEPRRQPPDGFLLNIDDEKVLKYPDADTVRNALAGLATDDPDDPSAFLILSKATDEFMQVLRDKPGRFFVEYRQHRAMYRCNPETVDLETAQTLFEFYLKQDPRWRTAVEWEKMDVDIPE